MTHVLVKFVGPVFWNIEMFNPSPFTLYDSLLRKPFRSILMVIPSKNYDFFFTQIIVST